jgi:hypothetical protein
LKSAETLKLGPGNPFVTSEGDSLLRKRNILNFLQLWTR